MKNAAVGLFKNERLGLLLIVFVGLVIRFSTIGAFKHTPESDELAYQSMALNLIEGNGIVDSMGNHAMYSVGYALFVLAPIFAIFGNKIFFARIANALLGGLAIILCHAVAKKAGCNRPGRLLAAAIWAVYLPASVYVVYLAKENLMIPLMLCVVWCALSLATKPLFSICAACGVLFGLLALTGNLALCLAAPVALSLVFMTAKPGQKLILSMSILIIAILVASPWMIRNDRMLGAPLLSTNGGFNLYLGNNPAATGMFVSIADTPRGKTWEGLRKKGELIASETLKEDAIAWIKDNPSSFALLALKKMVIFWMPPFHEGKGQGSLAESVIRRLWSIQFILLLATALSSLVIKRLRNHSSAILRFSVVCFSSSHMLFYVIFRYREPIMPLICILSAMTIQTVMEATNFQHRRTG